MKDHHEQWVRSRRLADNGIHCIDGQLTSRSEAESFLDDAVVGGVVVNNVQSTLVSLFVFFSSVQFTRASGATLPKLIDGYNSVYAAIILK